MKDAIANLDRERKAAQALRESMASLRLDEDTVRDTVEGETNLHEAIIAALLEITEFEALRDGVESVITKLAARKESFDNRIALLRSAIEQAMVIGEMKSFKSSLATLSIADAAKGDCLRRSGHSNGILEAARPGFGQARASSRAQRRHRNTRRITIEWWCHAATSEIVMNTVAPIRPIEMTAKQLDLIKRTVAADCSAEEFDLLSRLRVASG